jgi:hypothetical protein
VPPASPSPDRQRSRRGEQGTITLEAIVIYPLVLLIAWIGMQLALVFLANRIALASAEEGARAARSHAGSISAGEERAHRYLGVLGSGLLTRSTVQVERAADTVTVQVSGQAQRIVPAFPVHVTQAVHSPTERFRAISREFGNSGSLSDTPPKVVDGGE